MFTRRSTSCRYASRFAGSFLLSEDAGLSIDAEEEELDEPVEDAELLEFEDELELLELPDEGSFGRLAGVSGLDDALLDEDALSEGSSGNNSPGTPPHPMQQPILIL